MPASLCLGWGPLTHTMNPRIRFWAITASLAGFLFGFDTAVISGAEQAIQHLWQLSPTAHGLAMGAALYGTVIGALGGALPTDRYGRKATLFAVGALFFISSLWSALATDVISFMVARFIGGLGVGISTVAAPLYISEISPPAQRGRLAGLFQFNLVLGILIAFLSNALLANAGEHSWRWMLGVMVVPSLIFMVASLALAESPRWLASRKRDIAAAVAVLRLVEPTATAEELEGAAKRMAEDGRGSHAPGGSTWSVLLDAKVPLLLAFLIACFNQLSGINAVLYFAPRIFEMTGLAKQSALLQSVGIGVTNFVFTFVGLWLIDRLGRKTLLTLGSIGYVVSLSLVSWAFFTNRMSIVPICVFAFIASHAIGQGAVIWVFISEIFPNHLRAAGQAFGCFTHWIFAALLTTCFPNMVAAFAPGWVFAFFAAMMVLQWIWVRTMVPETRGVPLEEIQQLLQRRKA